jgi:hypothetical protein
MIVIVKFNERNIMKTNELKKGTRIYMRNGWEGTLLDNKKGNTRCAEIEGYVTEAGSVYAHDIIRYRDADGNWQDVDHTPAQLKLRKTVGAFGF